MFYQTRYPSANKWATLGSFKVNAVYQKLAQNLWVKRYGGPQLSRQKEKDLRQKEKDSRQKEKDSRQKEKDSQQKE